MEKKYGPTFLVLIEIGHEYKSMKQPSKLLQLSHCGGAISKKRISNYLLLLTDIRACTKNCRNSYMNCGKRRCKNPMIKPPKCANSADKDLFISNNYPINPNNMNARKEKPTQEKGSPCSRTKKSTAFRKKPPQNCIKFCFYYCSTLT